MINIFIRVDSGTLIGTGHVYRCLNLAEYIKDANIEFVCKNFENNLIHKISKKYYVHTLNINNKHILTLDINTWLGDTQYDDAIKTINIIKNKNIDWMIIDHYNIDEEWENYIKPYVKNIFVIDDFTNRKHNCNVLLNQQIEKSQKYLYNNIVNLECKLLLGKKYIILNKKFLDYSKLNNTITQLKRISIFMGGSDPSNETLKIINVCQKLNKKLDCTFIFDVIVGYANKNKCLIENICKKFDNFNFYYNIDNMQEIISLSDLNIGAIGGTSYERCILGIPSLVITIAENQKIVLNRLAQTGAVIYLGNIKENYTKNIKQYIIHFYKNPNNLNNISKLCKIFLNHNDLIAFENNINNIFKNII